MNDGNIAPAGSTLTLTNTQRVHIGHAASHAIAEECARLDAQRVFLLVSTSLRQNTPEIDHICQSLGPRVVAVHDGIPPHAPRSAVLEAAHHAREIVGLHRIDISRFDDYEECDDARY